MRKRANLILGLIVWILFVATLGLGVFLYNYVDSLAGTVLLILSLVCFTILMVVTILQDEDRNNRGGGLPTDIGGRGMWG